MSFDLAFRPNFRTYYGYIIRIIENGNRNIDIIYDDAPSDRKHFKLIIGDAYSKIEFEIPREKLFSQWNHIRLKFDFDKQLLSLYSGNKVYAQSINLKKNNSYKFLFGASSYHSSQIIDVPAMIISNVRIAENGAIKYKWELNEFNGNIAHEDVKQASAGVKNPIWMKEKHYDWNLTKDLALNGAVATAFDQKNGAIYMVSKDSVFCYRLSKDSLISNACLDRQFMIQGMQSIFIPYENSLLDINVDRKQIARFDVNRKIWDKKLDDSLLMTGFYHYNKFFSVADTSLYMIGGYGYHTFKNTVQCYHFSSRRWEIVKTGGSFLAPHYLSALGTTKSGAYILGGYGSRNGEQDLNPRYFYSLIFFNIKDRSFKKVYDLKFPPSDFVFANSMIIDESDSTYFALMFDKDKYESKLQLIHGSLKKPEFKKVGNPIPYDFEDIHSFADLFYSKADNRFIAVTLSRGTDNKSKVNIYTLYSPAITLIVPMITIGNKLSSNNVIYLIVGFIVISIVFLFYKRTSIFFRYADDIVDSDIADGVAIVGEKEQQKKIRNAIFLFGDLQVFDADGNELTKLFTPLIKELFLIIIIYSIRWGRGISSEKLEELLWSDKSSDSAQSNRSVNIGRLKNILSKIENCTISKESGYWRIDIDDNHLTVDYKNYLRLAQNKKSITKKEILDFTGLIRRGAFLSDVEYEWLDVFKSEIMNEIVDIYLEFSASVNLADDPKFMIQLANYIFNFDPVNEEAMMIKCKALAHLGKHSLAKIAFEKFSKEYEIIYGERFKKKFQHIMDPDTGVQS